MILKRSVLNAFFYETVQAKWLTETKIIRPLNKKPEGMLTATALLFKFH